MPMTVITLSNAPQFLRGDLTRWMQEIATGVYVGNFNSKVRDELWKRVKEGVGSGSATLSYSSQNELGYKFECYQTSRESLDYDGLELVLIPKKADEKGEGIKWHYSSAYSFHKARVNTRYAKNAVRSEPDEKTYIVLDIETTGTEPTQDEIIEIAALKVELERMLEFQRLIRIESRVPATIAHLTGINDELLKDKGLVLSDVLEELRNFIGGNPIVGYSVGFDMSFINCAMKKLGKVEIKNRMYDLLPYIKKRNMYLANYRLETVRKEFGVDRVVCHRAMPDAVVVLELVKKLPDFLDSIK